MPTETHLIAGERGISIPATLMRSGGRELAIVFPGLTYRNTMPVMHFSRLLMATRGADVFAVDYAYDQAPGFREASDDVKLGWIGADGRAALTTALGLGSYERITVIGKSLGTIAMGWAIPHEPRLAGADLVWLTPSLIDTGLKERMRACRQRSIVVIGTKDPAYDEALLEDLRGDGFAVAVIPEADHGLERKGDAHGSVAAIGEMVAHVSAWLDERR